MYVYADTDFFLALFKKDDWLKTNAQKLVKEYDNRLGTSLATIIEISLVCKKIDVPVRDVLRYIFEISNVEGITLDECIRAATYMDEYNMTVFDAFHAVLSKDRPIISSDPKYDEIGLQRIKLEKE